MRTRTESRPLAALLTIAACSAALTANGLRAQGIPVGFEESYALAKDRASVVANLIPGTEDWYYYHCRERLDARDFATIRKVLPTWVKRHGRTARVVEIENREALLSYGDNQERTFDFLRERLGVQFGHERMIPGAKSDLPTALDPNLVAPGTLTARALARHPNTVNGFHDRALAALAATNLNHRQLHSLLGRLNRPDVPNLPALVVRDLKRRESRGFGSLQIHNELRRSQLDECVALQPELLKNSKFVAAYLTRLQPNADTAWFDHDAARTKHLETLWAFAQRLSPSFNSLKAHILFHWLQHDLASGAPNKERFLSYIRLPRRSGHPAKGHLERFQRRNEHVNLRSSYPTLMRAIRNDSRLVQQCLEHFFQSEDSVEAYSDYLDARWLERTLAETKILQGEGDMERWYSLLNDPARLEQLEKRVELRFPPTLKKFYGANDAVKLDLETKNVKALLVKVFSIDSYRFHVEKQKRVDASIELDGVVPNFEQTFDYEEPPMRRVQRSFNLPMLSKPGTYVVEFVGNGISSRAVIHKGDLRMVERTSAAGQIVRAYDEAGNHLGNATAWFGGREYTANERGEILVPFSTNPGSKQLVLRSGNRSSIVPFAHRAESYELSCAVHVDRESIVAGQTARMMVRPQLELAGHSVALKLLSDPLLTIIATDLDGQSTTQEVRDLDIVGDSEITHEIRVPNRLAKLQIRFSGRVENLKGKKVQLSGNTSTFSFNGIDATAETSVPMLLRTTGGYAVELRGKSGELQSGRVCRLSLYHRDYRDPISMSLQTDDRGRIRLGRLSGIDRVQITKDGGSGGTFELADAACTMPAVLHGSVGQTLRVPYQGDATAPTRSEFTLLGHNQDAFEHLAIENGFVELRDLEPGDYQLMLHESGHEITVRVTKGQRDGRYLIGRDRVLEASPSRPLQMQEVVTEGDNLRVALANVSPGTRVHVVATRYMPTYDMFADLRGNLMDNPEAFDQTHLGSSYHAGRKLSDEYRYVLERRFSKKYPGNMLERPSLLLNPMALEENSWNSAVGLGGGAGGRYGGRGRGRAARKRAQGAADPQGLGPNAGMHANLDYLPAGSSLLANLRPDANGIVTIPLAQLGEGQQVHVMAIDGNQAVYESTVRAEQPLRTRSRTLPEALAADEHFVETKRIEFVAAGGEAFLGDARAAQVEIHDSLASIYRLFATISNSSDLETFSFLLEWPQLSRDQKLDLYSEHACHELHFFLNQKDPQFFRSVVRPFLANKLNKTFLDHWLLESDLSGYVEPWKFAQLNVVEKILLAQRLGNAEREAVARSLRESLELKPTSQTRLAELFRFALDSDRLSNEDSDKKVELLLALKNKSTEGPSSPAPNESPMAGAAPVRSVSAGRKPGAPKTRGLAQPSLAMDEEQAKSVVRRYAERDESGAVDSVEVEELELRESENSLGRELDQRKRVRKLYEAVADTKLLVEHNYWHRRMENPTTDAIQTSSFWVDYATSKPGQPFVSASVVEASGSFLEMMFALSVIDLPFEAGDHEITRDGDRATLKAATPLLLVRKEVGKTEKANGTQPLLLGQNFFRLDDRYRFENGQRKDAFVTDEFLVDVAYGCQVVVTNPTSSPRSAEVLLQVPEGAVPLQRGFWTRGRALQLAPYATATIEYSFYFPSTGNFSHYPAHAGEKGKLVAFADGTNLKVVETPSKLDTTSWEHVSQQGSPQEVMSFLDSHNVQRLDLAKIAWRMRDRTFFQTVLPKLKKRHTYDATLWSYGLLHRDPSATREYLRHRDDFLNQCGMWLDSPLAKIDPKERRRFQHLELSPLVHQRAHQLGSRRTFGNSDLANQYASLMNLLSYRPDLDSNDWLAVTYYFLLQDRIEDALTSFDKIDPGKVEAKVQLDYLSTYLCFFTGDTQKARRTANKHKDHAALHWQKRFRTVIAQLDEAEGKVAPVQAEQTPENLTATAPSLELAVEGRTIAVRYKNLEEVEVRYYEVDVEFAFSARPFSGPDGASAAFVQPNHRETRALQKSAPQLAFELPQQFWQKNVLVEVRAGGLVRSRQYFANALDVQFLESYGQVAVREPNSEKPLAKTYVKVFAKLGNGKVRFHKDGYTDLRGRFDYASLSNDPNAGAVRYSVLVLDEARGAVIREIRPPAR